MLNEQTFEWEKTQFFNLKIKFCKKNWKNMFLKQMGWKELKNDKKIYFDFYFFIDFSVF